MNFIDKEIFDKVYEPSYSIKQVKKFEKIFNNEMFGTLMVVGRDDRYKQKNGLGKIVHFEEPKSNKILSWAKHSMIKLLAGDIKSMKGANRSNPSSGEIVLGKGSMFSNNQFFNYNDEGLDDYNYTANTFTNYNKMNYPYFPTKMLFGTGFSIDGDVYPARNDDNSDPAAEIEDETETLSMTRGWVQSVHEEGEISGIDLYGYARGNWSNFTKNKYNQLFEKWIPSFIYLKRTRPFKQNSEMLIEKYDSDYKEYNKIQFSVVMPSQLDNKWYPYNIEQNKNGVMLKYAGLFCDASYSNYSAGQELNVTTSTPGEEFMYGMPWAKRAIQPVTKTYNISLEFYWTLYFSIERN